MPQKWNIKKALSRILGLGRKPKTKTQIIEAKLRAVVEKYGPPPPPKQKKRSGKTMKDKSQTPPYGWGRGQYTFVGSAITYVQMGRCLARLDKNRMRVIAKKETITVIWKGTRVKTREAFLIKDLEKNKVYRVFRLGGDVWGTDVFTRRGWQEHYSVPLLRAKAERNNKKSGFKINPDSVPTIFTLAAILLSGETVFFRNGNPTVGAHMIERARIDPYPDWRGS